MKQLFDYQICLMQILYQTAVISSAEVHVFYYAIAYCTSPKRYFILHPNFILPICFISHSSLLMFWLELCTHHPLYHTHTHTFSNSPGGSSRSADAPIMCIMGVGAPGARSSSPIPPTPPTPGIIVLPVSSWMSWFTRNGSSSWAELGRGGEMNLAMHILLVR